MTREELFSVFPRPWRVSEREVGSIHAADDSIVLQVDFDRERGDDDVAALAEIIVDVINATEE